MWASGAWALTPVTAKELQKELAFYQSIERLDVDFKQTKLLKDIALKLESEGHLSLKPPAHVDWRVTKPQALWVELDQQKITIHNGSSTQTFAPNESPSAKDRQSFSTMLSWLRLDAVAIAEKYEISRSDAQHLNFISKDPHAAQIHSLDMEMTRQGHVGKLVFHEASGDEIQIRFGTPRVVSRGRR